jgi:hypothetical protein
LDFTVNVPAALVKGLFERIDRLIQILEYHFPLPVQRPAQPAEYTREEESRKVYVRSDEDLAVLELAEGSFQRRHGREPLPEELDKELKQLREEGWA